MSKLLRGMLKVMRLNTAVTSARWPVERWIPALDATRGIAAFAVVVHHSSQQHLGPSAGAVWMLTQFLGTWGVALFFVLSGFCIHLPQARRSLQGSTSIEWGAFAGRRAWRLLPTHYAALVSAAAAAFAVPSTLITTPTVETFVAHVFMVHTFSADAFYSINAVFWSIALEVHFYAMYPVLLWVRRRIGAATVPVLGVVALLTYYLASRHLEGGARWVGQHLFLVSWWQWALGVELANVYVRGSASSWAMLVRFPGAVSAWAAASLALAFGDPTVLKLHVRDWLLPVACAAMLAAIVLRPRPLRSALVSACAPVGKFSYSLYLMHPVALAIAWRHASWRLPGGAAPVVVDAIAALALCWGFFLLVERHFLSPPWLSKATPPTQAPDPVPIPAESRGGPRAALRIFRRR